MQILVIYVIRMTDNVLKKRATKSGIVVANKQIRAKNV